ncbi:MAG: hypothetical protein ACJKSS_00660 [Patescibacteria group bacterium UBA2103]
MVDLVERVRDWAGSKISGGFHMRSGYYAGRPPSRGDINTAVLEGIYGGIKSEVGNSQARNFVIFVSNLEDMSGSSFVVALQNFLQSGCKSTGITQKASDRFAIDAHGDAAHVQAFGAIASALGSGVQGESEIRRASWNVKLEFLQKHWNEVPLDVRRKL